MIHRVAIESIAPVQAIPIFSDPLSATILHESSFKFGIQIH